MISFWFSEPHVSFGHVVFETIHLFVVLRFLIFRSCALKISNYVSFNFSVSWYFLEVYELFFAFLLNRQRQTVNCRLFFRTSLILVQLTKGPQPLGTSLLPLAILSGCAWDWVGVGSNFIMGLFWVRHCFFYWLRHEAAQETGSKIVQ